MYAKIAGFILLLGLSAAVHAHAGHHHPNSFEPPMGGTQTKTFEPPQTHKPGSGKVPSEVANGGGQQGGGVSGGGVTAPIPEPETYAMMMAGLGLVVAMARRRKEKQGS